MGHNNYIYLLMKNTCTYIYTYQSQGRSLSGSDIYEQ
jgi:hypothetical protein